MSEGLPPSFSKMASFLTTSSRPGDSRAWAAARTKHPLAEDKTPLFLFQQYVGDTHSYKNLVEESALWFIYTVYIPRFWGIQAQKSVAECSRQRKESKQERKKWNRMSKFLTLGAEGWQGRGKKNKGGQSRATLILKQISFDCINIQIPFIFSTLALSCLFPFRI